VRYRVEASDRPDALYAVWRGGVFRAQRSTADASVLLVALPGEDAPPEFDTEWNGAPALVVPESEAGTTFSLQTHCLYDDEIYRIAPQAEGQPLTLRWTGRDEDRARELGLVELSVNATPEEIDALWQARYDFADGPALRPEPGQGEQAPLLRGIGRLLRRVVPAGWERVAAQFRQLGDYAELEVRAVTGEASVSLSAPAQLGQLFVRLRSAMYAPGTGTWFQGTFTLDAESRFDFDFDLDTEPSWRVPPDGSAWPSADAHRAELRYFPREREHVPQWLAARGGLPLDVTFRRARIVDAHPEGEKPVVNRPPVPREEVRGVLDYLYRSPVATAGPGTGPDLFAPAAAPDVPNAFHTDGTWTWPAAVPHYLRKYGLPPESELVEHIRAHGYRPPHVGELLRATAEAEVLGKPRPPQTAAELPSNDPLTRIERDDEPRSGLRASQVLALLRRRLAEYGVAETAYRIGEVAEGAWCLRRTPDSWEVGHHPGELSYFSRVEEAARFLLGTLLLYPGRARTGSAEAELAEPPETATDWPILPLRGEPPLTYFQGKRMVVLPVGTTVQRFGPDSGNLVHAESARFAETSLAGEREAQRHVYQVRRALRVLTGITVAWNGMPGGAIAYLLPRPVGHHVETGALARP
jgi:hypothetical protein